MSDLSKTIIAIIITAVLSSTATTARLGADIANLIKSVDKIDVKLNKITDRTRQLEINQATYLVANEYKQQRKNE
jgi:hypothetical protein